MATESSAPHPIRFPVSIKSLSWNHQSIKRRGRGGKRSRRRRRRRSFLIRSTGIQGRKENRHLGSFVRRKSTMAGTRSVTPITPLLLILDRGEMTLLTQSTHRIRHETDAALSDYPAQLSLSVLPRVHKSCKKSKEHIGVIAVILIAN